MKFVTQDNRKWWVFVATAFTIMMVDLDSTAINLALASIAKDLNIGLPTAQWIIDGYMIAAAAMMAVGGKLSDIFGWRRIFIFGLITFILSSLAVGLSDGSWSVLISRIIQGSCIAFTFPVSLAIVRLVFPSQHHGFIMGLLIAIAGLSQALGPTVGSIIIHILGWRWIFFIDVPLALIALMIAVQTIPTDKQNIVKQPLPFRRAILLVAGMFLVMTALNEATYWGIDSLKFIGLLLLSACLLIIFVTNELRTEKPLLELQLFANSNFLLINIIRLLLNFIYFAMLFTVGLLLQNILGYSTLNSGYILLALTLVFGVLSIPAGKFVDKVGPKKPILIGFIFLMISNLILAMAVHLTLSTLLIALFLAGIAIALLVPATGAAALFSVQLEKTGAAMGIFLTNAFIGGSMGIAISGLLLAFQSKQPLDALINQSHLSLTMSQMNVLSHVASGVRDISSIHNMFSTSVLYKATLIVQETFIHGFTYAMSLCFLLGLVALILTIFFKLPSKV
jgi:EmrB/QacA subfamily drug resistance transporter